MAQGMLWQERGKRETCGGQREGVSQAHGDVAALLMLRGERSR